MLLRQFATRRIRFQSCRKDTIGIVSHGRRRAFSLLEVMVAMAIFLMALVGIGQLITLGGDQALEVQQQSQAIRLCQSKMAEVIAGVVPLSSQNDAPFDEDPDWNWSMDAEQQGGAANPWTVTIRITRAGQDNKYVVASLSQVVFDPTQRGSTLDIAAAASAAAQANSSASASGANSGTNSNTGATPNAGATGAAGGGAMPAAKKTPTTPTKPTGPTTNPGGGRTK
jgi:general secretion pathway protein I